VSPAEVAGGRYTLQERIAAGGMGEVWRATDTSLGRAVAIKLLRENIADDDAFRSRFASEAQHAASLHDPHIATVFDYGDEVDPTTGRHTTYLVMELVNGKPLSELITRPIAPDQAALLIAQAADGLAVAHAAGIVHRDVKPANFLVTPDGKVKVTDFGIARARGAASVTDTGMILGTPHYVAPEVAEGHEATPSSDLYSLGVVLYEALTATRPFDGETPIAIALAHLRDEPKPLPGTIPPPLRSIVESTMARDPARRPPDAATLAAALRRFADDPDDQRTAAMVAPVVASTQVLPTGAPATAMTPTSGGDPTEQTGRRRNAWLPIAAAVLAVLLIVGIAYAVTQSGRRHRPPKLPRPASPRRRARPPRPRRPAPPPRRRPPPSPSTPRPTSTVRSRTSRRSSRTSDSSRSAARR
jgi:eukaryotic-like serine/threonine-protein kinase